MEHRKRLMVMDDGGARETDLPASAEIRPGEEVMFEGKKYIALPNQHALSDDAEVLTTTHVIKATESVARG